MPTPLLVAWLSRFLSDRLLFLSGILLAWTAIFIYAVRLAKASTSPYSVEPRKSRQGGPRKFACSLPVKPQLGEAERGKRSEGFVRAHQALSEEPPEGVADRNGAHSITLFL
jgi:hypothetical protein